MERIIGVRMHEGLVNLLDNYEYNRIAPLPSKLLEANNTQRRKEPEQRRVERAATRKRRTVA